MKTHVLIPLFLSFSAACAEGKDDTYDVDWDQEEAPMDSDTEDESNTEGSSDSDTEDGGESDAGNGNADSDDGAGTEGGSTTGDDEDDAAGGTGSSTGGEDDSGDGTGGDETGSDDDGTGPVDEETETEDDEPEPVDEEPETEDDEPDPVDDEPEPLFFTVDEACGTSDFGYSSPSAAAREGLERTNCFRNLMGLEPGVLHPLVDEATQSHADYMDYHGTLTHYGSASMSGYTGDAVWDRIEATGYPMVGGRSYAEVVSWGLGSADAIDGWVQTVYHRIPFTTPYWLDVGFGQTGSYASMSFVSPYPNGPRTAVVYPIDGQREVPIDFDSDTEWPDPAPSHGVVGYPVTVTVAAETASGGYNPYDLFIIDATLTDEFGTEIDCIVSDPEDDDYLNNTAFMLPLEPLSPSTTYTAVMVIEWDGIEETIRSTFTTGT